MLIAALDRHLNDKGYKFSKQVLEGKARQLRQSSMGKCPNKARSLTEEEEEVLWEAEKFGSKTPEALISSMWWLLMQFFGLRGRQEHHTMKMEDFQLFMTKVWSLFIAMKGGNTPRNEPHKQHSTKPCF